MKTYKHINKKISNLLNRPLHEYLGFAPIITVTFFFGTVNILLAHGELPQTVMPLMALYFSIA
jgi:hypothetical protein